jgi:hypothetical protein
MWSSRKIVSDTYNACNSFNKRVQNREWTGGPIPEPAQANVADTDDLPRVVMQVQRALGELRRIQLERVEKPSLTLAVSLANFLDEVDEEGVIRLDASMAHVRLAFHVENAGDAPSGRSIIKVWVPRAVSDENLNWVTESGHAEVDRSDRPVRDQLKLPTGDGREFETQRMTWTLDEVDRLGETLYLRVECRVPSASEGEAMIPVHAEVRSAESKASADFAIRLRHVAG